MTSASSNETSVSHLTKDSQSASGAPRLLGERFKRQFCGTFQTFTGLAPTGANGPNQTLAAVPNAAPQLSHCCHSCIAQHFHHGSDRVADGAVVPVCRSTCVIRTVSERDFHRRLCYRRPMARNLSVKKACGCRGHSYFREGTKCLFTCS